MLQPGYTSSHICALHLHKGNLKPWPYNQLHKACVVWPQHSCEQLCYFCPKTGAVFTHIFKAGLAILSKRTKVKPQPYKASCFCYFPILRS